MSDEDTLILEKQIASDMSTTITSSLPSRMPEETLKDPKDHKKKIPVKKKSATWASNALKHQGRKGGSSVKKVGKSTAPKKQKKTFWEK